MKKIFFLNQATLYKCQAPSFCLRNDIVWGVRWWWWYPHHFGDFFDIWVPTHGLCSSSTSNEQHRTDILYVELGPFSLSERSRRLFSGHGSTTIANKVHLFADLWPFLLYAALHRLFSPWKPYSASSHPGGGEWSSSGCQLQESCLLKILERCATLRSRIFAAYYECARSSSWNWMFTECTTRNCWPFWRSLQRLCMIFWYQ